MSAENQLPAIDIPESRLRNRRRSTQIGGAGVASSLASTFQSWTGNLATTASTYMSDNIAIPASYLTANEFDHVEQGPTETTSIYSPPHDSRMNPINISLRHNPYGYYGVDGSSLASRYFSPLSGYGSFLAPIAGSPAGSVDYFDREAPEGSGTRPQMSRRASTKSDLQKLHDHPESVPLMRSLTRGSQVSASIPVSVIQDVHAIPMQYGSTFKQSIFNSCNILIGIGILALPLGFKLAGWTIGLSLFIFCLTITNYTAKILAKCLDYDEGLHTYADMGAIAFGEGARSVISLLFSLELLACATALVILVGDSLHTIFPSVSIITFKICAWIFMSPLTLMPIRYLSYFSLLGILSASYLAIILVFDGLSKPASPGSLLDPMETDTWPPALATVPLSFGLIMAGFTGHAVFPTIYRDMKEPKHYPKMVNVTYAVTATIYLIMACCGYLMFGRETKEEVIQNIMATPGYNKILNQIVVWMIAINPLAKYALTLNPINLTLEIYYSSIPAVGEWYNLGRGRRTALTIATRLLISTLVVCLAIQFPGFDKVMGILGSFFSYSISAIFPCVCHLKLFGWELSFRQKLLDYFIIVTCTCLASLGTLWAILT